jgi:2-oxoglutarate dehydrogenase E2 component (dihydrolipoamide succinyltransferase)
MQIDVRIPTLGESVTEGVIVRWLKNDGDAVKTDDPVLELETDKANVELPSPGAGRIKRLKAEGDTVQVGDVVAQIETDGATRAAPAAQPAAASPPPPSAAATPAASKDKPPTPPAAATPAAATPAAATPAAEAPAATTPLSPAVRRLVTEHGVDPAAVQGSGRGGRVTKGDVLTHLEQTPTIAKGPTPEQTPAVTAKPTPPAADRDGVRREPMTRLRQRIAERLVEAQHTAAILTTFNEVDMSAVMALRQQHKERFAQAHGVPLGFMSFFARACIAALRAMPIINAQIDGSDVVYNEHVHLGVAVSTERGLVVPIIHRAETMTFAEIEKAIERSASAARDNKLGIDDLSRGTFTISNGGVFGSLLSTPILNPPQSAILGMHKIEKRPVVVGDQIVIRPMMYLALSYDHRLIDGAGAVTFLIRVKEAIEDPTRLLLEV